MINCKEDYFHRWIVIKCIYDDQQKYIKFSCVCGAIPNQPCFGIKIDGVHNDRVKQYHEYLHYKLIT